MKELIDISNYEYYVMDYVEGTLTDDALEAFRAFLLANPDIAQEVEELAEADLQLEAPMEESFDKESLKVNVTPVGSINADNYETYFADSASGVLPTTAEQDLIAFTTQNPSLQKDYALYQRAVLRPDTSVVYDGKSTLKRAIPLWEAVPAYAYRVAAVFVLGLGAWTALQFMNSQTYDPRSTAPDFASWSVDFPKSEVPGSETSAPMEETQMAAAPTLMASTTPREQIATIPVLTAGLRPSSSERTIATSAHSYTIMPIAIDGAEEPEYMASAAPAQRAQELTLAQYLGREFLGVDPKDAPTTKALLRESVNKVAPNNEQFAIHNEIKEDNKKTLHILAGAFEFTRVNYKEN